MLMTVQASLAFTASKHWGPQTFSSQLHAGSPKGTSQAYLVRTLYMTSSSVH